MIMDESRLTYMYDVRVELKTVMCVAEQSTQLLITVWMYFYMGIQPPATHVAHKVCNQWLIHNYNSWGAPPKHWLFIKY